MYPPSDRPGEAAQIAWPAPRRAWYAVGILIAAYTLSYIDRQIISLIVEPIKADLLISDTQVSLLAGSAFVLFYVLLGLPFGWLADHGHRLRLIRFGIIGWTLMTALCGFAQNYEQLFLARIGVGIGEAALTPAALSIIADSFAPGKRARPLGLYMIALTVGPGLAFLFGGVILHWLDAAGGLPVWGFGTLPPWRALFLLVSLPSIPVVALLFTLREPQRRELEAGADGGTERRLSRVFRFMFVDHRSSFAVILFGWGVTALNNMVILVWTPTLFIRIFGWSPASIGVALGLIVLLTGSLGIYLGPSVVARLQARGHDDAYLRAAFLFTLALMPLSIGGPILGRADLVLVSLAPAVLFSFAQGALIPGVLQAFTPNRLRGQVGAVFSFFNNIIGMALGSTAVALFTDYLFRDEMALPYSMALTSALCLPTAALLFRAGFRPFAADVAAARAKNAHDASLLQGRTDAS